jgi:hypothetical protein
MNVGNNDINLDLVKRKVFNFTELVTHFSGIVSLHIKATNPKKFVTNFMSIKIISSNMDQKLDCQKLLKNYFLSMREKPARWLSIISSQDIAGGINERIKYCESLPNILGLDCVTTYLPFMIACNLITRKTHPR